MSATVELICGQMQLIAPIRLAEEWDNVGLLLGDRSSKVERVMTCLTVTPDVVTEAVEQRVNLLISHHPLPFKPLAKVTSDNVSGQMVWDLCRAGIAVYSAHTAHDSAIGGINDQWIAGMEMKPGGVLIPHATASNEQIEGAGRWGEFPEPISAGEFLNRAAQFSSSTRPRMVGDPNRLIRRAGVACGSGGGFVAAANRKGCDLLLTGEATFHACLEAENTGLSLAMVGHFASERFAMERLAHELLSRLATVAGFVSGDENWVRSSENDRDPIGEPT